MLRHLGHVNVVKMNLAAVHFEYTGNGVQESTLPCAVAADHRNEITGFHFQTDIFQRQLFIHRTGEERFADSFYLQHLHSHHSAVPFGLDQRQG